MIKAVKMIRLCIKNSITRIESQKCDKPDMSVGYQYKTKDRSIESVLSEICFCC